MTVTLEGAQTRDEGLLIDGLWRRSSTSFERRNPARPAQVVGRSAAAAPADVADAYAAAAGAARAWARTPAPGRGDVLRRAADLVEQRSDPIATALALEEGKAIRDARGEVHRAAAILRYHGADAHQALGEIYPSATAGTLIQVVREPLGVVCVITPWNFPIAIPAWKIAPALALGNTVVWKPAEIASGTAALLAESLVDADADLDRAANCIVRSAMLSTGQRCTATSRAIVVDGVFDAVAERLIEASSALRVGDPLDERTDLGPLASAAQFKTVTGYLEIAAQEGLQRACGGTASDPAEGYFVQPTVYVDVDPASRLCTDEIFGPVLTVIRAADTTDAMRLANATEYGLSGSIFTRDLSTAIRCAGDLEAGVVHLNGESAGAEPHVPFGGVKASSTGAREQGTAAREFFTRCKTIYIEGI